MQYQVSELFCKNQDIVENPPFCFDFFPDYYSWIQKQYWSNLPFNAKDYYFKDMMILSTFLYFYLIAKLLSSSLLKYCVREEEDIKIGEKVLSSYSYFFGHIFRLYLKKKEVFLRLEERNKSLEEEVIFKGKYEKKSETEEFEKVEEFLNYPHKIVLLIIMTYNYYTCLFDSIERLCSSTPYYYVLYGDLVLNLRRSNTGNIILFYLLYVVSVKFFYNIPSYVFRVYPM